MIVIMISIIVILFLHGLPELEWFESPLFCHTTARGFCLFFGGEAAERDRGVHPWRKQGQGSTNAKQEIGKQNFIWKFFFYFMKSKQFDL